MGLNSKQGEGWLFSLDEDRVGLITLIEAERAHFAAAWRSLAYVVEKSRQNPECNGITSQIDQQLDYLVGLYNLIGADSALWAADGYLPQVMNIADGWDNDPVKSLKRLLEIMPIERPSLHASEYADALTGIWDSMRCNAEDFYDEIVNDPLSNPYALGIWPKDNPQYVGFFPERLESELRSRGYIPEEIIQQWANAGWLLCDEKSPVSTLLFGNTIIPLIKVKLSVLESI